MYRPDRRKTWRPWKRLERSLFLLFSVNFGNSDGRIKYNIHTLSVNVTLFCISRETGQTNSSMAHLSIYFAARTNKSSIFWQNAYIISWYISRLDIEQRIPMLIYRNQTNMPCKSHLPFFFNIYLTIYLVLCVIFF